MKIAIVTALVPNKDNKNGPSGLIWEIQQALLRMNHTVETYVAKQISFNAIVGQLSIMGFVNYKLDDGYGKADKIIVYPDVLIKTIPKQYRNKCIVVAPDATSMVRLRKYSTYKIDGITSGIKKLYQFLFFKRFMSFEKQYIKQIDKYIVVGEKDREWLIKNNPQCNSKIHFLRHPILSATLTDFADEIHIDSRKKRFIFSGDMSYSYLGNNIELLNTALKNKLTEQIDVVVVGKRNHWIYDIFKTNELLNTSYIEWIDDYRDICHIGSDIHCVPLKAGAGTKNRVVTAIANGLTVITTSIGSENILLVGLKEVYETNSMEKFAEIIKEKNSDANCDERYFKEVVEERKSFRERTTRDFIDGVKCLLK